MNNKIFFNLNYNQLLSYILFLLLLSLFHFNSLAEDKSTPKGLEGYQVNFDYKGHPVEREIAYQFYKENYKYFDSDHPLEKSNIGIDLYDIDNDGQKEILTYLQNSAYCGSRGCSFEILKSSCDKKNNTEYYTIPLNVTVEENIKILNSITLGYHDIEFDLAIWRWNGKKYDFYKKK